MGENENLGGAVAAVFGGAWVNRSEVHDWRFEFWRACENLVDSGVSSAAKCFILVGLTRNAQGIGGDWSKIDF